MIGHGYGRQLVWSQQQGLDARGFHAHLVASRGEVGCDFLIDLVDMAILVVKGLHLVHFGSRALLDLTTLYSRATAGFQWPLI